MDRRAGHPDRRRHRAEDWARRSSLVLPATVQAWYEAPIYARVTGYLKNWYFDYGAHVKKGDVLAEIEAPESRCSIAARAGEARTGRSTCQGREAEKQFANDDLNAGAILRAALSRSRRQRASRPTSTARSARLNAAEADVEQDQGDVDRLQALEGFKKIVAPFDGVVTARETDVGALINAGSGTGGGNGPELFKVADIREMRIYVQVPQQLSAGIRPGSPPI